MLEKKNIRTAEKFQCCEFVVTVGMCGCLTVCVIFFMFLVFHYFFFLLTGWTHVLVPGIWDNLSLIGRYIALYFLSFMGHIFKTYSIQRAKMCYHYNLNKLFIIFLTLRFKTKSTFLSIAFCRNFYFYSSHSQKCILLIKNYLEILLTKN